MWWLWRQGNEVGEDLLDPAADVFIKVGGTWHHLSFEGGIVFWSRQEPGAVSPGKEKGRSCFLVRDDVGAKFSLKGLALEQVTSEPCENGARVILHFRDGRQLVFHNEYDETHYSVGPAAVPS
jgi:hypothetical protein